MFGIEELPTAEMLSRIQFAFTISFHIIFPSISIGLSAFLAMIEAMYLKTGNKLYMELYRFWLKIFAVVFAMGVVSGVIMSYEFGTNWPEFSKRTANVLGPLFAFEILTAFFLEASFLSIMLFGFGRVGPKMHFFATCAVALGTEISAFWILSANSWMHTPSGYIIDSNGLFMPTSWWDIIFNPSFPYRLAHMLNASYITAAFIIGGTGAIHLLRGINLEHAKLMLKCAVMAIAVLTPIQILIGDLHGLNTLHHQPAKVAAMEGLWETKRGADLKLFAIPDEENELNHAEISIPKLGSLILTHSADGVVRGLKEWPKEERAPVKIVFWSFRVMVGSGFAMLAVSIFSLILLIRKRLFTAKYLHMIWVACMPLGVIAILAGWFVTECGRQPYVVYGLIKRSDILSNVITNTQVLFSLSAFVFVYAAIFGSAIYYIIRLIKKGVVIIQDDEQFYKHTTEGALTKSRY